MPDDANNPNSTALNARILLFETDEGLAEILKHLLRNLNCRVLECASREELPVLFASREWDAVFCDQQFADALLPLANAAQVPVILIAGYDEIDTARQRVSEQRAFAWLPKPLPSQQALKYLQDALLWRASQPKSAAAVPVAITPSDTSQPQSHYGLMVGESAPMQELYRQIDRVAESEMTVLIIGESGTGKELVAKAIHSSSGRAGRAFVPVNCASLSENLLESELFGHVKGAFTGAVRNKDGLFVAADGGTLFLDEIGSVPLPTQLALLRALQEHEVRPVGAVQSIPVNVRVVAATNENLEQLLAEGRLRQDLYYRLSAFTLKVPPLRERAGDLPLLAAAFLNRLSPEEGPVLQLAEDASVALARHAWPGNVRELAHALERGATLCEGGMIRLADLPPEFQNSAPPAKAEPETPSAAIPTPRIVAPAGHSLTLKAYLKQCEQQYIQRVLEEQGDDKEKAAKILGVSVATLYRKLM